MTSRLLNGEATTWLLRALWMVLFAVGGYFINMNDKRLGAIEARADYMIRESQQKDAEMSERLARLEERVRILKRRNDLDE